MRGLIIFVVLAMVNLTLTPSSFAAPPIEPGISLPLAKWRAKHYRDVRYALRIQLLEGAGLLKGNVEITVQYPRKPVDLILDWRGTPVRDVRVNGVAVIPEASNEHLVIGRKHLKSGGNIVQLAFDSPVAVQGSAVTRYKDREDGSEYLYTLLVPADASTLFPCFDQPDLKGRFSLELELPPHWKAVANSPIEKQGNGSIKFRQTEPISTYLFAFAAGPFETLRAEGDAVRLYVRRSRLETAKPHVGEVLRLNREATAYFERYFARKFPFAKYDLVLLPEFAYGGMEHAGATFLNEERVLFPAPPSATDLLRRAQLIFHETSHQWFGDLVTMRWFDDLWLKEGFANFMAAKATEALLPEFDAWTAFHALKTSAVRTDATRGTTAIRYPLQNLADAKSAYGNIVYSKGPAVLRQAEFYLGEAVFQRAVRDFVRRHAYAAAGWQDLVRAFERASGRKLNRWADAWVQRRGMPTVRITGNKLEQRDALGENGVWPMKLRISPSRDVFLEHRSLNIRIPAGRALVFPNYGDFGYGRFLLDAKSIEAVLAPSFDAGSTLLRAQLLEAIWESVREAELAPERFLSYALEQLPKTRDDIALAGLLGRIEGAFRRYLNDAQRDAIAPAIEGALRADGAGTSRDLLLTRTLIDLAWSPAALQDLKRLLRSPAMASRDRFRIIRRLTLRGDPEAPALLAAQTAADPGDDGRRYAYAAGAADPAVKRSLFDAFLDDRTLPESWIETALGALNAPEQAAFTQQLLPEALARLPELKRTRKIFFVANWLAAFIGGQTGPAALAEVETFLRRGDIDADLRLKVLEAIDGLERAVRIRETFGTRSAGK
ncbi:MAG: M1 family aminopeptidase [Betaproteobacteria bacterium]